MVEDMSKEPGNWELYRGIERVEAAVHEIGKNALSSAVFAVEKQALTQRIDTLQTDVVTLRAEQVADRGHLEKYKDDQDKQAAKNRLFVIGIIAAAFMPRIVDILLVNLPV